MKGNPEWIIDLNVKIWNLQEKIMRNFQDLGLGNEFVDFMPKA